MPSFLDTPLPQPQSSWSHLPFPHTPLVPSSCHYFIIIFFSSTSASPTHCLFPTLISPFLSLSPLPPLVFAIFCLSQPYSLSCLIFLVYFLPFPCIPTLPYILSFHPLLLPPSSALLCSSCPNCCALSTYPHLPTSLLPILPAFAIQPVLLLHPFYSVLLPCTASFISMSLKSYYGHGADPETIIAFVMELNRED